MEEEHRLLVLLRCSQTDALRFGLASRAAAATLSSALEALALDAPRGNAGFAKARNWAAVSAFLRRHPRVRRLSFRGARIRSEDLESLLTVAPSVVECDVRFALPLSWPSYSALRERPEMRRVAFRDTLAVEPDPDLSPQDVVVAQAYGLHCGRVDVCFRFASPSNKAATGPLERFGGFFEASSRYQPMLRCESFHLGFAGKHPREARMEFQVAFKAKGGRTEHNYVWQLSKQTAPEVAGCWMTEGVIPIDIESMWDGSMVEE